jgi:hypothetical protein
MLFVVIGTSTCSPNTCYQIEYKKISNIDNTPATKKRQAITGVRQKASTAHGSITMTLMD